MSFFSMAGSAFSTLATGYFWLVRARREKPNLRPHVADRDFFLGSGSADSPDRHQARRDRRQLQSLAQRPARRQCGSASRRRHLAAGGARTTFDAATPLPFDVPSMQTVLLRINGYLSFPTLADLETGSKTLARVPGALPGRAETVPGGIAKPGELPAGACGDGGVKPPPIARETGDGNKPPVQPRNRGCSAGG